MKTNTEELRAKFEQKTGDDNKTIYSWEEFVEKVMPLLVQQVQLKKLSRFQTDK